MKKNKFAIITGLITLAIGLLLGWIIFGGNKSAKDAHVAYQHTTEGVEEETTWTCSMHPQIRQPEEGDCPICGMDLIPLEKEQQSDGEPASVKMSTTAMQLASVSTAVVGEASPVKTVRLNGKVEVDERLVFSQSLHIPGRINELKVNFTGDYISKGEPIATVYSPELVTAQEELFEAEKMKDTQPRLFQAAKKKLANWNLTVNQIQQILEQGVPQQDFPVLADVSGYVVEKMVNRGDYIQTGETIYEIADLSKIWVLFDVYERDIPWVKEGDAVKFSVQSLPGKSFEGTISFFDLVIDPKTRVAKARVVISNRNLELKPEMFVSGTVESQLQENSDALVVPKSAVMWTGKRSLVYVKSVSEDAVSFVKREVTLGPGLGDSYIIEDGLLPDEEIAVNGTFSIDAAAQLAGKPSMMASLDGQSAPGHSQMRSDDHAVHTSFKVGGNCSMCKDRIEAAALSVEGVASANWEAETQTIHLNLSENTSIDDVHHAIAQSGHDTEKERAADDVYNELPGCCLYNRFNYEEKADTEIRHVLVKVAGNCGMCKDRIEKAALSVDGVISANWDAETEMVHLDFDSGKTSSDEIQKDIAKAGHDTEKFKAPGEVYENLPGCCLYGRQP